MTAVRLLFSVNRNVFHLTPDEPAIFGMARWMSGGTPWNMFNHNTWQPGMSVLLVPLFWMTDRPYVHLPRGAGDQRRTRRFGSGHAGTARASRITDMPTTVAALASGGDRTHAGLARGVVGGVWAEPLVTVTFLGCLTLTLSFVDDRRFGPGARHRDRHRRRRILFARQAAPAPRHRGRDDDRRRAAEAAPAACSRAHALVSAAAGGSAFVLSKLVIREVWDQPNSANTAGSTLSRLIDPLAVIDPGVGQLWYLLASTALVFGIGTITLISLCGLRPTTVPFSAPRVPEPSPR